MTDKMIGPGEHESGIQVEVGNGNFVSKSTTKLLGGQKN
jgi:hypothetical protein